MPLSQAWRRTGRIDHALEFLDLMRACQRFVLRRMYGSPHYFALIAIADNTAYEAFVMDKLTGHPAVRGLRSRLTMKTIKDEK
ncbi:hypothetical protein ACGF3J_38375 [Streptomyces sp. NPDC048171]|uniref:Lrp/AsnC ligand binding domain-containing protein n=1 Tax=Streptomyces sp. NPDC048171 TaxID=3365504 RepID=UPI003723F7A0